MRKTAMGRSYWFECSKCGYGAKVCGRADRGFNCFVRTIACHDCKELYDAVYRLKIPDEPCTAHNHRGFGLRRSALVASSPGEKKTGKGSVPSFQTVLNQLPYKGVRRFKWLEFKLLCPVSEFHRVEVWDYPGKCPRCGIFLEKNVIPFRVWD